MTDGTDASTGATASSAIPPPRVPLPGGECLFRTGLLAALAGAPFLGIGVLLSWWGLLGGEAFRPVDAVGIALLSVVGAAAMFRRVCLRGRGTGAERWWIIAAGVAGGVVLPAAAPVIMPTVMPPAWGWTAALLGGWGCLAGAAFLRARGSGTGRGSGAVHVAGGIALSAGRAVAAALLMAALDGFGPGTLPRIVPAGWGPATGILGLLGVLLVDERGVLPLGRLTLRGCRGGGAGCVLGEGEPAPVAVTSIRE